MVLFSFISAVLLALFRDTYKYSLLPIFFALFIKGPCTSDLINIGGDDIYYQRAFVSGTGLSDALFTKFYHNIYLLSGSLDFTYISISFMTLLLCFLIYTFNRYYLSFPYSFKFLYPVLSILPMILTGAIRQNFGYLVGLEVLVLYVSFFYGKPRHLLTRIVPALIIFSLLGHFSTVLFVVLILSLYNYCYLPLVDSNVVTVLPLPLFRRKLDNILSFFYTFAFRKSSLLSVLLLLFAIFSLFSFIFISINAPSSLYFLVQLMPNLFLDFHSGDPFLGLTLFKKFAVIFFLYALVTRFRTLSYSDKLLISLLEFFLILSLLIAVVGWNVPSPVFPKLMRVSTFLEIASLFLSSALLPRLLLLFFSSILFVSVYLSAVARDDYLVYIQTPFINALSYCVF